MDNKKFLIRLVLLIFFIFLVNYLAMEFYWYTSIWYLDMIMHFLGGFWIGLLAIYLFSLKDYEKRTLANILSLVLVVGIGWEVFEILVSQYITENPFNFLDTFSDLFFDLAGGLFALFYFLRKTISIEENKL